jgi:glycosyltransferase involved in cell wall biosynthesis
MKVLLISPFIPYPPISGGKLRIYELASALQSEVELYLLARVRNQEELSFEAPLKKVFKEIRMVRIPRPSFAQKAAQGIRFLRKGLPIITAGYYFDEFARVLDLWLREDDFDCIHLEFSFMLPYIQTVAPYLKNHTIVVMQNVEAMRFKRMATYLSMFRNPLKKVVSYLDANRIFNMERQGLREVAAIVVTSEQDKAIITEWYGIAPSRIYVVPNGTRLHTQVQRSTNASTILFVGSLDYYPNVDCLLYFIKEILPQIKQEVPDVKFLVVGGGKPPRHLIHLAQREPSVRFLGYIPDLCRIYEQASLVVVPLRIGGGTRLKILEAFSYGVPVVSTTVGAEGLKVKDGEHLIIADTPSGFALSVIKLLKCKDLQDILVRNSRILVQDTYNWESIKRLMLEVYKSVGLCRNPPLRGE